MANSRSAQKQARVTERRTQINRPLVSKARTAVRRVRDLAAAGEKEKAVEAYGEMQSRLDKAAKRGAMHKNAANRTKARVAKLIK